jgi:hypothetical protein
MKKYFVKLLAFLIIGSILLTINPGFTLAWEQGPNHQTHQWINKYALERFFAEYSKNSKYVNAEIDQDKYYWGPKVDSYTLKESGHVVYGVSQTFVQWVEHGGYSADEPHLWASVKHFYDPLSLNDVPELTDHSSVHGWVYDAVSAREWAFHSDENPFGWRQALEYYYMSMEIPEDKNIKEIPGINFRDPILPVESVDKARRTYLGKAFRSLGETMHMIADMTQPAHTRNDSHPTGDTDPIECYTTFEDVDSFRNCPVDPRVGGYIDSAQDIEHMYEEMALYSNKYFYTDDTIYDADSLVLPWNDEACYPHPQFSELVLDDGYFTDTYSGEFNGELVPMIQRTFTGNFLNDGYYTMPSSFAKGQAKVLLPIAVKACTRVLDSFFPTFELKLGPDNEANEEAKRDGSASNKNYLKASMKHLIEKDIEWQLRGLKIEYCGPAELDCIRKGKTLKLGTVEFKDGELKDPLMVYTGALSAQDEEDDEVNKFKIEDGDELYIVIKAGGRTFTGNKYKPDNKMVEYTINYPSCAQGFFVNIFKEGTDWTQGGGKGLVNGGLGINGTFKFQVPEGKYTAVVTCGITAGVGENKMVDITAVAGGTNVTQIGSGSVNGPSTPTKWTPGVPMTCPCCGKKIMPLLSGNCPACWCNLSTGKMPTE